MALSVTALGWLLQLFSVILFTFYLVADGPRLRRTICSRLTPEHQERVLQTWELASTKTGGYLYSRALLALLSTLFHWIVFQSMGTASADRPRPVGRHRQPVPAGRRHLHRRGAAGDPDVPRLAAQGADRVDRDRRLPADRELRVRAPHHRPHDAAAPGPGVRVGARWGRAARRRRRDPRPPGGGDGTGTGVRGGNASSRRRQRPDDGGRGSAAAPARLLVAGSNDDQRAARRGWRRG